MYEMCIFLNINHYHRCTSPTLSQEYPHIVSEKEAMLKQFSVANYSTRVNTAENM